MSANLPARAFREAISSHETRLIHRKEVVHRSREHPHAGYMSKPAIPQDKEV